MRKFTFRGKQPLLFVFVIFVTDHGAEIMVFSERLLIIGIKLRRMTKCIAARLFEFGRRRFGDVFRAYGRGIAGAEIRHLLLEVLFLRIREVRGEHSRDGETLERCQVELELSRHLVTVHVDRTAVHQGCIFIAALFPFRIAPVAQCRSVNGRNIAHLGRRRSMGVHLVRFAQGNVGRRLHPFEKFEIVVQPQRITLPGKIFRKKTVHVVVPEIQRRAPFGASRTEGNVVRLSHGVIFQQQRKPIRIRIFVGVLTVEIPIVVHYVLRIGLIPSPPGEIVVV